jgi:nucleoside-diphosphate-sugar epimerase
VLLTGAAGLIGRHALDGLAGRGFEVHAVSRGGAGDPVATWHDADLRDGAAAGALVEAVRPTHLLHLAWETTHGAFWTSPENMRWLAGSAELLRAFGAAGGRRAVVAGTCAEYLWDGRPCSETRTPLQPATLYGACKHALHVAAGAYAAQAGFGLAWGRVFLLYGPGEPSSRLVPAVAGAMLRGEEAACSHGRQVRDLLHAADVGDAFAALLDSAVEGPVNVASGEPVTIAEVVEAIGRITGRPDLLRLGALPAPPGDPAVLVADVARLRDEVGWRPRLGLEEGLRRTIESLHERTPA